MQALLNKLKNNDSTVIDVNLSDYRIDDTGAKELAEALKINSSLKSLNLRYNKISDTGAKYLAEALKINSSLKSLNLDCNGISAAGAKELAQALKINSSLKSLNLEHNYIGTGPIGTAGAKYLAEALKINSSLKSLNLENNNISDTGAKYLAEVLKINSSLESLELGRNNISAAGAKDLAEALKINSSLKSLKLEDNNISDTGAKYLAEALKINSSLKSLDLEHNNISDTGAKYLAEVLKINSSLESLELGRNNISDTGAKELAEALKINSSLKSLELEDNNISAAGAKDLAEALKINSSLKSLDLRYNNISDTGAKYLAEALKINSGLKSLCLGPSNIRDTGAKELAEALKINSSLKSLDLRYNKISAAGAKELAEALKINSSLKSLNLRYNKISAADAKELAQALKINSSLKSLDLRYNNISDTGAKELAEALKINSSLKSLDLGYNNIIDTGAKDLAEALKINSSLKSLDLECNWISAAGAKDLTKALEKNYLLLQFQMVGYHKAINSYLARNKNITTSLNPLTASIKQDTLIDDSQKIEDCIINLSPIVPGLADDCYPVEAHRLLTGLGHYNSGHSVEASIETLHTLLPSFNNPHFQRMADKMLGLLLAGDFSHTLKQQKLSKEGWLLTLYAFRNHLQSPELLVFAQTALFRLIHGMDKSYSPGDARKFQQDTVLLTHHAYLDLLKQALVFVEQDSPSSFEGQLLASLLYTQTCHAFSLATACQSSAFLKAFTTQYPNATGFTTVEHCILTANAGETVFIMNANRKPERPISEGELVNDTKQLAQDKVPSIRNIMENVKQTIANAFPTPLIEAILGFCNKPVNENVAGLIEMKTLIASNSLKSPATRINELIALAKWKKSGTDFTCFFHKNVRGRADETEMFYQALAGLKLDDGHNINQFLTRYTRKDDSEQINLASM